MAVNHGTLSLSLSISISISILRAGVFSGRQEYRCNKAGIAHPLAAPGYFLSEAKLSQLNHTPTGAATVFQPNMIEACTPFVACVGTCSVAALAVEPPAYAKCSGAAGDNSCTIGYSGERCSACVPFDKDADCNDATANGYYRLDGRCEPCPCNGACQVVLPDLYLMKRPKRASRFSGVSMAAVLSAVAVGLLLVMFLMDYVMQKVKHISTIVAPGPPTPQDCASVLSS